MLPVSMLLIALGLGLVLASMGNAQRASQSSVQPTTVAQGAAEIAAAMPAAVPTATEAAASVVAAGAINFDTRVVQTGRSLFQTTCTACHASNARGIPGLGKDLINSDFVRGSTDEELLQFIIVGRPANDPLNTTGIIMPARGANPALSDAQIHDIIVYLRSEAQAAFGTAYLEGVEVGSAASVASQAAAAPAPTEDPNFVLPITLLGLDHTDNAAPQEVVLIPPPADPAARAYNQLCAGCHGLQGEGVENLGTPLERDASDADQVFSYLTTYQQPDASRYGWAHPSRHVFLDLATDDALRALADYTAALASGS